MKAGPGQRTDEALEGQLHAALDQLLLFRPIEHVAFVLLRAYVEITDEETATISEWNADTDGMAIREQWIAELGNVTVEAARQ